MKNDEGYVPSHGSHHVNLISTHISKLPQISGFHSGCKHVYVGKIKEKLGESRIIQGFKDEPSTNLLFVPHLN